VTSEDFVAHVAGHAGVALGPADAAARIVLSAMGGYLTAARREEIAEELPEVLSTALLHPVDGSVPLEERLLVREHNLAHARELIASVCHVLAEELSREALDWLWLALPADLSQLLTPPAREFVYEERIAGVHDTLSTGKPGSHHALGDAHARQAQANSIADENPHGGTKLSNARGMTQDRRHDTLAEADVDPSRPLSTAKP
jgi:uncharacterized protein (DUF2267 family)